jgi:hypothetical protein
MSRPTNQDKIILFCRKLIGLATSPSPNTVDSGGIDFSRHNSIIPDCLRRRLIPIGTSFASSVELSWKNRPDRPIRRTEMRYHCLNSTRFVRYAKILIACATESNWSFNR